MGTRALFLAGGGDRATDPDQEKSPQREAQAVWKAVQETARFRRVAMAPHPWASDHLRASWRPFAAGSVPMLEACAREAFRAETVDERSGAYRVMAECVWRDLEERGIPRGPRPLLQHLHRAPELVEVYFPGYAQKGLLSAAVTGVRVGGWPS